jgi:hypothetical protein
LFAGGLGGGNGIGKWEECRGKGGISGKGKAKARGLGDESEPNEGLAIVSEEGQTRKKLCLYL